jgi:hypothetical protein
MFRQTSQIAGKYLSPPGIDGKKLERRITRLTVRK